MIKNESKARSPKSQGVINGRSKKSTIRKRHKICRNLVSKESDSLKTKNEFLERYREKLYQEGINPIPSDQTLEKDIKKCKIGFASGTAQFIKNDKIFGSLGYDINCYLRQIRLVYNANDITLLDTYAEPIFYPRTLNEFLSPLTELIDNTSNPQNTSSSTDILSNKSKKIAENHLIYLHFILYKKGFESLIEDAFCQDCNTPPYFLYIETHSYCTTIVFEYNELKNIIEKTYKIIKHYPFQE